MIQTSKTIVLILSGMLLTLGSLYMYGYFLPTEYIKGVTEAYVTGANPPAVVQWEMY